MKESELVTEIFSKAKENGLKDVSIRITENQYGGFKFVLHVRKRDRFYCQSLESLLHALSKHKELSWMNN